MNAAKFYLEYLRWWKSSEDGLEVEVIKFFRRYPEGTKDGLVVVKALSRSSA